MNVAKFPTPGFIFGWALGSIVYTASLEVGTLWPYLIATGVLSVYCVGRLVDQQRKTKERP